MAGLYEGLDGKLYATDGSGAVETKGATPMKQTKAQKPRFHVEGQTSTEGARWQICDGQKHFAPFTQIACEASAERICEALNIASEGLSRAPSAAPQND